MRPYRYCFIIHRRLVIEEMKHFTRYSFLTVFFRPYYFFPKRILSKTEATFFPFFYLEKFQRNMSLWLVVAKLIERSISTPEDLGSKPVSSHNHLTRAPAHCTILLMAINYLLKKVDTCLTKIRIDQIRVVLQKGYVLYV